MSNNTCVGSCVRYTDYKNNYMIHPFYIQTIENEKITPDDYVCPVLSYKDVNNNNQNVDKCNEISNLADINHDYPVYRANYLLYSYESYLKNIYKVYTYTDVLEFIANKSHSFITRQRVLVCAEYVYIFGGLYDNIFYVNFFLEMCNNKYQFMYNELYKYVGYVDDVILFVYPENNKLKKNEYIRDRIKYLSDKLVTFNKIQNFLKLINDDNLKNKRTRVFINDCICVFFRKYCVEKIMLSLSEK